MAAEAARTIAFAAPAVGLSAVAVHRCCRAWRRCSAWSTSPGGRKVHARAVPLVGGIAIFVALLAAAALRGHLARTRRWFLLALSVVIAVGFWDDVTELSPAPQVRDPDRRLGDHDLGRGRRAALRGRPARLARPSGSRSSPCPLTDLRDRGRGERGEHDGRPRRPGRLDRVRGLRVVRRGRGGFSGLARAVRRRGASCAAPSRASCSSTCACPGSPMRACSSATRAAS